MAGGNYAAAVNNLACVCVCVCRATLVYKVNYMVTVNWRVTVLLTQRPRVNPTNCLPVVRTCVHRD